MIAGLNFPPIGELFNWQTIVGLGFNKTAVIDLLAMILTLALFIAAARKTALVPRATQNLAEMLVDFINNQIILETVGTDGLGYMPFLLSIFCFVFVCNIFEIVPFFQFPADARLANPLFLAVMVWAVYNWAGMRRHGVVSYFKNNCVPPGVPFVMLLLVVPIEALQLILIRPLTLAIRLFANMMAGHLLLVTFALLADALFFHNTVYFTIPLGVLPAVMEVVIMLFEVLIAVLQAFIFTILTGVYLGSSLNVEH